MAKAIVMAGDKTGEQKAPNQLTGFVDRSSNFLKDVRNEMRKVVTPSRQEVQTTTIVVIFTVFAFAAFFAGVDYLLTQLMQSLLHWLGSAQ